MSWISITRLVARREIAERLRSRLLWIMTALTTLLVVALIVIPALVRQPAKPTVVGLVGASAQTLGRALQGTARAAQVDIRVVDVATAALARSEWWWEMALAVLLTLGVVYGMVRLAARIYAPALVRGGGRLSWGAALRLGAD